MSRLTESHMQGVVEEAMTSSEGQPQTIAAMEEDNGQQRPKHTMAVGIFPAETPGQFIITNHKDLQLRILLWPPEEPMKPDHMVVDEGCPRLSKGDTYALMEAKCQVCQKVKDDDHFTEKSLERACRRATRCLSDRATLECGKGLICCKNCVSQNPSASDKTQLHNLVARGIIQCQMTLSCKVVPGKGFPSPLMEEEHHFNVGASTSSKEEEAIFYQKVMAGVRKTFEL